MPAGKATIQSVLLAALCLPGAYAVPRPARQDPESILLSLPSAEIYSRHLLNLTEEPHPAGSRRNMELADYVRDRFIEYGLEDVHFHDTPALLSRSVSASVA